MFAKALLTIALLSLAVGQCYAAAASVVRSDGSGNICPDCVNPKIIEVPSAAPEVSAPEEGVAARSDGSGNICPDCVNPKFTEVRSVALEVSVLVDGVDARSDVSGNTCLDCDNPKVIGGCGSQCETGSA
ncbi:hypothetical protein DFH09DRAFT_1431698 [Mycena vulgaris]|nr:hypothetical protein DFH09DRAFT_1431698 [Mycena vulgaris]